MPRRRKSNALKLLEGTDRPDRHKDEAEFPLAEGSEAPDWLHGPEAVAEWELRVRLLEDAGVLTEADLTILGHYCNMHGRACVKWRAGSEPTAAEMTQLRMMATEFGFTPASRHKAVPSGSKNDSNAFANLGSKAG